MKPLGIGAIGALPGANSTLLEVVQKWRADGGEASSAVAEVGRLLVQTTKM